MSAITENGRNYPLKQNCNFQTETSFCASKSPKFPCSLSCKAVFLSNKHNTNRNDEQAFIKKLRKCHVCAELRSGHAPLSNGLWTHMAITRNFTSHWLISVS